MSERERRGPSEVVGIDDRARDTASIRRMVRRLDAVRSRESCGTGERLLRLTAARVLLERAAEAES